MLPSRSGALALARRPRQGLNALLRADRSEELLLEKLRVAKNGVDGSSELMGRHGQELVPEEDLTARGFGCLSGAFRDFV